MAEVAQFESGQIGRQAGIRPVGLPGDQTAGICTEFPFPFFFSGAKSRHGKCIGCA